MLLLFFSSIQFILLVGIFLLAVVAYQKKALNGTGAIASVIIGTIISIGLSLFGLVLLAAFFLSSTILGRICDSSDAGASFEEKGETRDAFQVMANGGWAAVLSLLFIITEAPFLIIAFIGSLAAATSDTWASTIGKSRGSQPTVLFTNRVVPAGQSGGTTRAGNIAAMAGSTVIALLAFSLQTMMSGFSFPWWMALLIAVAGFFAQVIDAAAGAVFQGLYRCNVCEQTTERRMHCNTSTHLVKGSSSVTNDTVNHLCTISGAVLAGIAGYMYYL